ncbi:MAG: hypothetical protein EZS28_026142 [Streblomastix strix]|uniref:Uncharacterized protein n=1 Tax=Streblomastix strix TaxID=222440 RepID=A0A5J4V7A7_9EUKA|nr:MAG: hypothetical protein EZS28_026142 [Streblomastix strix]
MLVLYIHQRSQATQRYRRTKHCPTTSSVRSTNTFNTEPNYLNRELQIYDFKILQEQPQQGEYCKKNKHSGINRTHIYYRSESLYSNRPSITINKHDLIVIQHIQVISGSKNDLRTGEKHHEGFGESLVKPESIDLNKCKT